MKHTLNQLMLAAGLAAVLYGAPAAGQPARPESVDAESVNTGSVESGRMKTVLAKCDQIDAMLARVQNRKPAKGAEARAAEILDSLYKASNTCAGLRLQNPGSGSGSAPEPPAGEKTQAEETSPLEQKIPVKQAVPVKTTRTPGPASRGAGPKKAVPTPPKKAPLTEIPSTEAAVVKTPGPKAGAKAGPAEPAAPEKPVAAQPPLSEEAEAQKLKEAEAQKLKDLQQLQACGRIQKQYDIVKTAKKSVSNDRLLKGLSKALQRCAKLDTGALK